MARLHPTSLSIRSTNAYSLVELLVVVSIVGILSTFAKGKVQQHIEKSSDTVARQQLKYAIRSLQASTKFHETMGLDGTYAIYANGNMSNWAGPVLEMHQLLPGYTHTKGVFLLFAKNAGGRITIQAAHCKGSSNGANAAFNYAYASELAPGYSKEKTIVKKTLNPFAYVLMQCN